MSNGGYAVETVERSSAKKSMRIRLKAAIRRWLQEDDRSNHLIEPVAVSSQSEGFQKDFTGWTIRIHKAQNGHIIEAWRRDDGNYINKHPGRSHSDHEMILVTNEEDVLQELPHVLTSLMMRG